jgi:aryl-alcohol dehydrogenase-like predicted oxidoreductase
LRRASELLKRSLIRVPIPRTSNIKFLESNSAAANIMLSEEDFSALSGVLLKTA